jgi:tetratricopeptide (TPR) repeat protein
MKQLAILLLSLSSTLLFGQNWKDTLNQARKYYEQGKYKEALKYYKSAEQIAPKDVDLSIEKGQTAYKAGDYKTAAESFERKANSTTNMGQQQKMRSNLGESHMKQQNYQGAVEAFKEVLRHDSNNEKARQRLMEAQRLLKQQQQQQQQQQQNNQDNQDNQNKPNKEQQQSNQSKLQDKETERKLDELSKQEQAIKKRLNGSKGKKNGQQSTKDW